MTPDAVTDARSAATAPPVLGRMVRLGLMNRGIIWSSGGLSTNTVMSETVIHHASDAFADVLIQMRPALSEWMPRMLT